MPQVTNLTTSPYFDDFVPEGGDAYEYYKVLFKPGFPIQARELNNLQSYLQYQIEKFGNHIFKEGSRVTGGELSYSNNLDYVIVDNQYFGEDVSEDILPWLVGETLRGRTSGVTARIDNYIDENASGINRVTLYVSYITSNGSNKKFVDGEILELESEIELIDIEEIAEINQEDDLPNISVGDAVLKTVEQFSTGKGSGVVLSEGYYFLRGFFVFVEDQFLLTNQYGTDGDYKIGFSIDETIVTPNFDSNLNDNAAGFSNYAAPGADRLSISAVLDFYFSDEELPDGFVTVLEIKGGEEYSYTSGIEYNEVRNELARRTYQESGNYYVKQPSFALRETLDNYLGNDGVYKEGKITYSNNIPNENLVTYSISPLTAFVYGYEINTLGTTYIDIDKPRTVKTLKNQSVNYYTGPTFTLNRVYGSPQIGFGTYYVSLRDSRVGSTQTDAAGKEIGVARVYDFALEAGSYETSNKNLNRWDIALYDIQPYTEITLNEPITLQVPAHIKGNSSGAVGYLRYDLSNSGILTAYGVQGNFYLGESFVINGISESRVSTALTSYNVSDVKSIYGIVGSAYTFTGDTILREKTKVDYVSISAQAGGTSTVSSSEFKFRGSVKPGDIVSYTNTQNSNKTFSRVETVSDYSLTISSVTTVSGICNGALPTVAITPNDFKILKSSLQNSSDDSLYTPLPKSYISSIDLTDSNIIIRKNLDVTITNGTTGSILSDVNEVFLPFDEERYCLISETGETETLTADKFTFSAGSSSITISGLETTGPAKLICTLRKTKVTNRIKDLNRVKTIVIDKSKYQGSGVGATTLNDGLQYGNFAFGTRVQDEQICLLDTEVLKIHKIYESSSTSDPEIPKLIVSDLSGQITDAVVGERIFGLQSESLAAYVQRDSDSQLSFVYLNENKFIDGEIIRFKDSGIAGVVVSSTDGDIDVTNRYDLVLGQRDTILDYAKIQRKPNEREPKRKLKVIFESLSISDSDSGDVVTVNSYDGVDYCDLNEIDDVTVSDIIDIRPRVSTYTVVENSRSPFEFFSRTFANNSSRYVFASDESFNINYSYYLPRIDRVFLSKDGLFQISKGEPAEAPSLPPDILGAVEVATVELPAYLCNIDEASITLHQYKRYTMSDIESLETRISNLEYYTTLSLLEVEASSIEVKDATTGLNRFKSGFYVDDFSTTTGQKKVTLIKNFIDIENSSLRPSAHTTEIDLVLGTENSLGISDVAYSASDFKFEQNLLTEGLRKTGKLLTLDYEEIEEIVQDKSTKIVDVSAYSSSFFGGSINLSPSSDVWIDQVTVKEKTDDVKDNIGKNKKQKLKEKRDPQVGSPVSNWKWWDTFWCGKKKNEKKVKARQSANKKNKRNNKNFDTKGKPKAIVCDKGSSNKIKPKVDGRFSDIKVNISEFKTFTDNSDASQLHVTKVSNSVIPYLRSRNIEFEAKRLKPNTQVFPFFDGIDVSRYVVPKLLRIRMISGTFQVGETVVARGGALGRRKKPDMVFRIAAANHKEGPYNAPTETYNRNPYGREVTDILPDTYSSTSTILNLDTFALANQPQGDFYGYLPKTPCVIQGFTSKATAEILEVKLVTDELGDVSGCLWIPNPNLRSSPKFEAGTKTFTLTDNRRNNRTTGFFTTLAEEKYYSQGQKTVTTTSTREPSINIDINVDVDNTTNVTEVTEVTEVTNVTNVTELTEVTEVINNITNVTEVTEVTEVTNVIQQIMPAPVVSSPSKPPKPPKPPVVPLPEPPKPPAPPQPPAPPPVVPPPKPEEEELVIKKTVKPKRPEKEEKKKVKKPVVINKAKEAIGKGAANRINKEIKKAKLDNVKKVKKGDNPKRVKNIVKKINKASPGKPVVYSNKDFSPTTKKQDQAKKILDTAKKAALPVTKKPAPPKSTTLQNAIKTAVKSIEQVATDAKKTSSQAKKANNNKKRSSNKSGSKQIISAVKKADPAFAAVVKASKGGGGSKRAGKSGAGSSGSRPASKPATNNSRNTTKKSSNGKSNKRSGGRKKKR